MLAAKTVEVNFLCNSLLFLSKTFIPHIGQRSVKSNIIPYFIMEKFTNCHRVKIVNNFCRTDRCIGDTFNAVNSYKITRAKGIDILNLMKYLTSTLCLCDFQLYKKYKCSKDASYPAIASSNHSETPEICRLFTEDEGYIVVYTDGACENNGKPNAKAGIGVWFGDDHPLNVSQPVLGRATNNTAEIQACVKALEILHQEGVQKVRLKTDSQFTISCVTQWMQKWKVNNWKLASGRNVKNKDDLIKLNNILEKLMEVEWVHIRGHKGERGNEEADKLARNGALLYKK